MEAQVIITCMWASWSQGLALTLAEESSAAMAMTTYIYSGMHDCCMPDPYLVACILIVLSDPLFECRNVNICHTIWLLSTRSLHALWAQKELLSILSVCIEIYHWTHNTRHMWPPCGMTRYMLITAPWKVCNHPGISKAYWQIPSYLFSNTMELMRCWNG